MANEISVTPTAQRGLSLSSFADAFKFSEMVASSDFAPKDFKGKPASCLLAIQAGGEIGLSPMQALQSIAVVNGRPSVYGDAALAVCMASAVCEYVTERVDGDGDATVAICEAKRKGYPKATVTRFSVADAKKAGLWGKSGPWTQYPKRMLQLRARGFALRDCFPDVLKGLVTAEEAADYPTTAEAPSPVPSAPRDSKVANAAAQGEAASLFERAAKKIDESVEMFQLEEHRNLVDVRRKEGKFTDDEAARLVELIKKRAGELMDEDAGLGRPEESPETEGVA